MTGVLSRALAFALSFLTVLPLRTGAVTPRVAAAGITLAPLAGVLLGAVAAAVTFAVPGLLGGLLAVAALALGTRGLHLDGLADTVDGLGCYGGPDRALAVMRDGGTGPFAVVTLVLTVGAQAAAFAALPWYAVGLAVVAGRVALVHGCRRGAVAARPDGLGALVAGSQPVAAVLGWWLVLAALAGWLLPWLGAGVLLAAVTVELLVRHAGRRFGGVTGDVFGACCELAVTVTAVVPAAVVTALGVTAVGVTGVAT